MTAPHAYWAEITAEGPVYGRCQNVRVTLGRFRSPFIKPALGWAARRALHIAERLDPAPGVPWCPAPALRPAPDALAAEGDVPTRLRQWAASETEQLDAYRQLRGGDPWALIIADHSGIYSFTVWPVNTRTAPHPPLPTLRGRHRKRLAELVHAPP
ncbi:hypothetical protein ACIQNG_01490 [Streptomyces sp. NPDC091377]|uniref:hypothetical protein n=1 Tax=Streptomyces sp. NPDC091377 TaxID=3365995 RepID=UPI0037F3CFF1